MTRATQHISLLFILSSVYLAAFLGLVPLPETVQAEIVPVLPFWAVVSFGAYLLFSLGWGVLTFKDTEKAFDELVLEIDEAKRDLRAKGVDVD